jgi:phenylalanyl-tRNA synthetase beta chain
MKFTLSWLKKFLETDATTQQIIDGLNNLGLEVEEVVDQGSVYEAFMIAEIISVMPHPEASKLQVCQVNNGKEILQIVCGAPNARAGIKVVLAPIGADIPANGMKIKASKIRNISSFGMLCSGKELNLSEESDGIIELSENFIVGESFAKAQGLEEVIIEISITPNRGDCLGVYGIARDLAAAGFGSLKPLKLAHLKGDFSSPLGLEVNSTYCQKYIGRYFKNIKNTASPKWLQDLLKSIGQNPISSLVDITNYFTFAFGRPLHVFDADLVTKLVVREALDGEEFIALNDKSYKLNQGELVIADDSKILALAGIIGEKSSGVSVSTKNILLEIGLFDADSIVRTARVHQIDTDAKYRFERKVDPEFMEVALDLATEMIIEICGGEFSYPVIVDNLAYKPNEIKFPLSELKKRIGIAYDRVKVCKILTDLGFKVQDLGEVLHLSVPSWRSDISAKEDIVEEIARIDGYHNIQAIALPERCGMESMLDSKQQNIYRLQRFAASLGLDEVVNWSFVSSDKAALFADLKDELYLKNPISQELDYMRPSILTSLLEVAVKNQNRGLRDLGLFEMASVFYGIKANEQPLTLSGLRVGLNEERNIYSKPRMVDSFDCKADALKILSEMGVDYTKLQYVTDNLPKYYHPGRSSALALGKNILAFFGELHPNLVKYYGLDSNAVGFEVFLDNIPTARSKYGRKGGIQYSDYQMVERDFAFIMKQDITIDQVIKAVAQLDKQLIKTVNIFDIYSGKNIEEGKKSVAFTVAFQANDRTLSDVEIEQLSQKIIDKVASITQGVLRSGS